MIPIRNIYYMLAYAFQVLKEQGYKSIETEQFDNVAELCAAILSKGVSLQLKRGLGREYIEVTEPLSTPRGRFELSESLKTRSMLKRQLACTYDEFSENSYMNRIIKTTMELLLHADIAKARKKELRKLLVFFGEVETLDHHTINWKFQYNRNNQTYRMLIAICNLVIKGLLQTKSDGTTQLMDFLDEQRMCRLYEKFILEYYRKEFPRLSPEPSWIKWELEDGFDDMLPGMKTDITLTYGNDVLIIDAKYYDHIMQTLYDSQALHSGNLYQIFTYVKNKDASFKDAPHTVSGMLLYAGTEGEPQPDQKYRMSGNQITVTTLNLDQDFSDIAEKLNSIVDEHFGTTL